MSAEISYIQCPNCDYICTRADLTKTENGLWCPSCGDNYAEGLGEDYDWRDPAKYMTEQQIQNQLDWQKQIKEKGVVQAIIDEFKPTNITIIRSKEQDKEAKV